MQNEQVHLSVHIGLFQSCTAKFTSSCHYLILIIVCILLLISADMGGHPCIFEPGTLMLGCGEMDVLEKNNDYKVCVVQLRSWLRESTVLGMGVF